jgi:hypothetical protein
MNRLLFLNFILLLTAQGFSQSPKRMIKKIGSDPIYFIDSANVDASEIPKFNATEAAIVNVYKGKDALELMGEEGKDGVVYIETKNFARNRYWKYFCSKSKEYTDAVPRTTEKEVQYILNDKILQNDFEGNLALIDDSIFEGLKVIGKRQLKKRYKIKNKTVGVVIRSGVPQNLYNGKNKF